MPACCRPAGSAQSASTGTAGVQAASRMSARLGMALTDGRALGARTQVLKSSSLGSAALAKRLAQDSEVEWAVVDGRRFITSATAPNDPLYPDNLSASLSNLTAGQWYLRAPTATYVSAINGPGAWARPPAAMWWWRCWTPASGRTTPTWRARSSRATTSFRCGHRQRRRWARQRPDRSGRLDHRADAATSAFSGCTVGQLLARHPGGRHHRRGRRQRLGMAGVAPACPSCRCGCWASAGAMTPTSSPACVGRGPERAGRARQHPPGQGAQHEPGRHRHLLTAYQDAVSEVTAAGGRGGRGRQ
jgi:serine protease